MRIDFFVSILLLAAAACSQRVSTEEEFAQEERERPLVTVPMGAPGTAVPEGGPVSAPPETSADGAQTIRGTIEAPAGAGGGVLFLFVRPADAIGGPPQSPCGESRRADFERVLRL